MPIKRPAFLLATLGMVALLVLAGCQYLPFKQSTPAAPPATSVVKRGTIQVAVTASGNVTLPQITKLGFSGAVSGSQAGNTILAELNVTMGSAVKKGQVIARLDTSAQERVLVKLKNNLETAQLALQKVKQPAKPEDIAKAEASVAGARSSLALAQANLEKARVPYTDNDFAHQQALVASAEGAVRDAEVGARTAQDDLSAGVNRDNQNIQTATLNVFTVQSAYDIGRATDFDLQKAQDNLTLLRSQASTNLTTLRNNISKANDTLARANDTLASARYTLNDMLAKKNGDPLDVQQKQNSVVSAQNSLTNAEIALATLKEPPDPIDVRTQELRVQSAQWDLDDANDQVTKSTITAPFDGVIGDFKAKIGDAIQPGSFVIPIVDTKQARVDAYVEEYDVNSVRPGMPVIVTLDAVRGQTFDGSVDAISPLSTTQQGVIRYAVTIKIAPTPDRPGPQQGPPTSGGGQSGTPARTPPPSARQTGGSRAASGVSSSAPAVAELKDGLSATASIIISSKDNVLLIPNRALLFQGGQQQVQVLVNGLVESRLVKVGMVNDTNTEITDGLNEGDLVVIQTAQTAAQQTGPGGLPRGVGGILIGR